MKCKMVGNGFNVEDKRRKYKNKDEMLEKPRVVVWNKIFKTEIIKQNNLKFPEGLIYEDLEFYYKLLPYLNKISYVEKSYVHYVQRSNSISNIGNEKVGDIFKILDNIFEFYIRNNIYGKYKKQLNYMKKRILLGSSMKRIMKIKNKKLKKDLIIKTFKNLKADVSLQINGKGLQEKAFKAHARIMNNLHKQKKLKIIFGITSLQLGGAERVLVDMANNLEDKFDITIFTIYKGGDLERELRPDIKVISLYKKQNKILPIYLLFFGRYIYFRYIKNKFDVEIAFLEGPITRIFSYNANCLTKKGKGPITRIFSYNANCLTKKGKEPITKIFSYSANCLSKKNICRKNDTKSDEKNNNLERRKKIAWVHNDIKNVFGRGIKAKLKKKIDKKIYQKYDEIIFVSEDNKKSFNEIYKGNFTEKVIYNYIDKNRVLKKANEEIKGLEFKEKNEPVVLTVARLVKQKGLDRFAKIHKKIIDDGILHKVYVIGDGEEKENLQKLIKKLGVEESFILLGKKENPYPYIKKCDLFALLSYFEGYGMVIEEAKVLERQIIITDTAAKEALGGYDKAIIAKNNEQDIYERLETILKGKLF